MLLSRDRSVTLKSGRTIVLRPLDFWDTAGADPQEVDRLVNKADRLAVGVKDLVGDLRCLQSTRLVQHLAAEGFFEAEGLFSFQQFELLQRNGRSISMLAKQLVGLRQACKGYGPRVRPEHNRLLTKIYKHVREKTRKWHDTLLADILNELLGIPARPITQEALKQWRYKHGLFDSKKVTPKSNK